MRKVILFIGISLDGYIADEHGGVSWMQGESTNGNEDDMQSYKQFVKGIDTVLLGWNTYHQIATELNVGDWPYKDFCSYVFTHRDIASEKNIKFTNQHPELVIEELKQKKGKDIWLCGGATLVHQLMEMNLIDQFYISVLPVILGKGISLFKETENKLHLKLLHTQTYNGICDLVYERR